MGKFFVIMLVIFGIGFMIWEYDIWMAFYYLAAHMIFGVAVWAIPALPFLWHNTKMLKLGLLTAALSSIIVDIDHPLYELLGIGEPTGIWIEYPGRWLHDDFFVIACFSLVIGLWYIWRRNWTSGVFFTAVSVGIYSHLFADLYIRLF